VVPYTLFRLDTQNRFRITSTERRDAENWKELTALSERVGCPCRHRLVDLDLDRIAGNGALVGWESDEGAYDWIILGEVIEHIPSIYAPRILRFFHRILTENGRVIITTPNLHGFKMRLRHLLGVDFTHDPLGDPVMGYPHINLFSSRQLCDLSRANRFRVREVLYRDFTSGPRIHRSRPTASGLLEWLRVATLSRLQPSTCDDLVICLQKSAVPEPTSSVFGRFNSGLFEGVRAVRFATRK
jgi:hypothetical protein